MKSIVIAGASLAGVEAARVLREEGYDGRLTILGDEPDYPYDRPPLSKGFLDGSVDRQALALTVPPDDVVIRVGTRADRLFPSERAVQTSAGDRVVADGVIVATGARARRLATPLGADQGVHVLRTLQDARQLRDQFESGKRLVVVGGGFIGAEVAATAVGLGLEVIVVEAQAQMLLAQLGESIASTLARTHASHGVRILTERTVAEIVGDESVAAVRFTDGTAVPTDLVLVGVGSEPAVDWLAGSGVALGDGVLCDSRGRTSIPHVVAVGDCAAWRDPSGRRVRRQHWTAALRLAGMGARTLLDRAEEDPAPWDLDYVWSDQYDSRLQVAGRPSGDLLVHTVSGQIGEGPFTVAFQDRDDVIRAVASVDEPRQFGRWRRLLGTKQDVLAST